MSLSDSGLYGLTIAQRMTEEGNSATHMYCHHSDDNGEFFLDCPCDAIEDIALGLDPDHDTVLFLFTGNLVKIGDKTFNRGPEAFHAAQDLCNRYWQEHRADSAPVQAGFMYQFVFPDIKPGMLVCNQAGMQVGKVLEVVGGEAYFDDGITYPVRQLCYPDVCVTGGESTRKEWPGWAVAIISPAEYGARAFERGLPCAAVMDGDFMDGILKKDYAARIAAYGQWNAGWVAASLE